MNVPEAFEWVSSELNRVTDRFSRKRRRNKRMAFGLRIGAVFVSGSVAVLLGFNASQDIAGWLKNVALVLGVLIMVMNAMEAFFDHRALWVRETVTRARLRHLKMEMQFYAHSRSHEEMQLADIERFMAQMREILREDLESWIDLRKTPAAKLSTPEQDGGSRP
jgi:hypothetical protein